MSGARGIARAKANYECTGTCGDLGCQWELPWLQGIASGVHIGVEVGDGNQAGGEKEYLEELSLSTFKVLGVSQRGLCWYLAIT